MNKIDWKRKLTSRKFWAAVSTLPSHAVLLCSSDGFPIEHKCYKHVAANEPEQPPTADDAAGEA